jgi:hypothetical protein
MSCKKLVGVVLGVGLFVAAASAQVVAPPAPGGFRTRALGGGDVNINVATPPAPINNTALIQTLRMRIDGLVRQRRYDEAEAAAMDLLQRSPGDERAIAYLRLIQAQRAALESPLQKMIVPKVEFREAAMPDVLKFLQEVSGSLTADKRPLSFVLQLPAGVPPPTVTLSLQQVPMLDLLRYVTAATGLAYKVEPHAVVISKPQPPPAPAAPANP